MATPNIFLFLANIWGTFNEFISAQSVKQNQFVTALADALMVPYASPGGKAWATVVSAIGRAQPVYTFDDAENAALLDTGARPAPVEELIKKFAPSSSGTW
jgi:hypothetical protein